MKLNILSDANAESRVAESLHTLPVLALRKHVAERDYGTGLSCLLIGVICRNPELKFKRRIRFEKKDKTLSMDIMFSLPEMIALDDNGRKQVIMQRLVADVRAVISKYALGDFDAEQLLSDFEERLRAAA